MDSSLFSEEKEEYINNISHHPRLHPKRDEVWKKIISSRIELYGYFPKKLNLTEEEFFELQEAEKKDERVLYAWHIGIMMITAIMMIAGILLLNMK